MTLWVSIALLLTGPMASFNFLVESYMNNVWILLEAHKGLEGRQETIKRVLKRDGPHRALQKPFGKDRARVRLPSLRRG